MILCGTKNGSSMTSLWRNFWSTFIFKSVYCENTDKLTEALYFLIIFLRNKLFVFGNNALMGNLICTDTFNFKIL